MDSQKLDKTLQYFSKQSSFCHTLNVTNSSVSQTAVLFLSLLYEAEKKEHGDKTGNTLNIIVRLIVHVMPAWATLNEMLLFIAAKQKEAWLQHHLPFTHRNKASCPAPPFLALISCCQEVTCCTP